MRCVSPTRVFLTPPFLFFSPERMGMDVVRVSGFSFFPPCSSFSLARSVPDASADTDGALSGGREWLTLWCQADLMNNGSGTELLLDAVVRVLARLCWSADPLPQVRRPEWGVSDDPLGGGEWPCRARDVTLSAERVRGVVGLSG